MYRFNDFTTEKNSPSEAAILGEIGGILEAGGSTITVVSEIQRKKFAKNFWNVAFSSFSTLTRSESNFHHGQRNSEEYIQLHRTRVISTSPFELSETICAVCIASDSRPHLNLH